MQGTVASGPFGVQAKQKLCSNMLILFGFLILFLWPIQLLQFAIQPWFLLLEAVLNIRQLVLSILRIYIQRRSITNYFISLVAIAS